MSCGVSIIETAVFLRSQAELLYRLHHVLLGGLIPGHMLITSLGLYKTRWVMVLPVLVITFNVMICRSAFEGIPNEIFESASIDGANEMTMLYRLAVPIIKPTLAVLTLYYAVFHWNNFFTALLYLGKQDMQPLTDVPAKSADHGFAGSDAEDGRYDDIRCVGGLSLQVRYVSIVVSILPIVTIYPFIQRYFVKGITLGAVKG